MYEQALAIDPEHAAAWEGLASNYALGRQEEHRAKLDELIERWGDEWPNKAVPAGAVFDPADPVPKSLANDPRWLPFLASTGRSPEQLAAIKFEVKLPAQ